LDKVLAKLSDAATDFNELQLQLFIRSLIAFAVRNQSRFPRSLFEATVSKLDEELAGLQREKEFLLSEDRIREAIRTKI
jgi:hypothetical protein